MSEELKATGYEEEAPVKVLTTSAVTLPRTISIGKMYKSGNVLLKQEGSEDMVEVPVPVSGIPIAEVGASCRMTINLGNYETVQLEVSVKLPSYVTELEDAYRAAKAFVDHHLNKEVAAIREYRAKSREGK